MLLLSLAHDVIGSFVSRRRPAARISMALRDRGWVRRMRVESGRAKPLSGQSGTVQSQWRCVVSRAGSKRRVLWSKGVGWAIVASEGFKLEEQRRECDVET